jgi:hypothetical protein
MDINNLEGVKVSEKLKGCKDEYVHKVDVEPRIIDWLLKNFIFIYRCKRRHETDFGLCRSQQMSRENDRRSIRGRKKMSLSRVRVWK